MSRKNIEENKKRKEVKKNNLLYLLGIVIGNNKRDIPKIISYDVDMFI